MMFVFYPRTWDRIAWQASVTAENAARLVDSPLRQEIARRLLDGQSAVWVLLECGDGQAGGLAGRLEELGYREVAKTLDLAGRERVVEGTWE